MQEDGHPSQRIWQAAEQAVVDGDVATLEALLREHGDMVRTGPVQSSWWGGLPLLAYLTSYVEFVLGEFPPAFRKRI